MIVNDLHRQPLAIDREQHRRTVLRLPVQDWGFTSGMNALFVTAAEMSNAARDYPVVWVRAGQGADGRPEFAPVAVFGLAQGENLYLQGTAWRPAHMPALMATYPFCIARLDAERYAVCVDAASTALAEDGDGERLIGDDGEPTEFMRRTQADLEQLEAMIEQTRAASRRLHELDLLVDRRFDASLPDGRTIGVDGFMTVDEDKVKALPDASVLELHRSGLLGMIHAHWVSLGHMSRLVSWRLEREARAAAAAPGPTSVQ